METIEQPYETPLPFRGWFWLSVGLGVYRIADWAYGGRQDTSALLSGIGFLLLAPGIRLGGVSREHLQAHPRRRLWLACSWIGAALVVGALLLRYL
ncbi:hypothetical protein PAGU2638_28460 [Lysobacter sp. PAGU 2638]